MSDGWANIVCACASLPLRLTRPRNLSVSLSLSLSLAQRWVLFSRMTSMTQGRQTEVQRISGSHDEKHWPSQQEKRLKECAVMGRKRSPMKKRETKRDKEHTDLDLAVSAAVVLSTTDGAFARGLFPAHDTRRLEMELKTVERGWR